LILISIDTLRADHLGCYNYPRPTSPTIDALAAEGVVFEDASTTSPWTLPSHASMLTGLYPRRHGLRLPVNSMRKARESAEALGVKTGRYEVSQTTLAERLGRAGYATAGFVNFTLVSQRYGFDRGFQQFRHIENNAGSAEPSKIAKHAVRWIESPPSEPFFLFLHFYDVHSPYRSLPKYRQQFVNDYAGPLGPTGFVHFNRILNGGYLPTDADVQYLNDIYDAGIRQLDDSLAGVVASLEKSGLLENTLIVITSDHGEQFMEHGTVSHGSNHYQEVLRIPWIIRGPGVPPGERIETMVSLVDLMPTVLGILGVESPGGLDGVDVASTWRSQERLAERYLFAEAEMSAGFEFDLEKVDVKKAVRNSRFKLHYNTAAQTKELYDLLSDPGETQNLADAQHRAGDQLMRRLEQFLSDPATSQPVAPLSPEQRKSLKSVGYID
jgi:arylsulfatase A-like enzyme